MNNRHKIIVDITPSTYIRHLNVGIRRKLSDFLDPQDRWKDVIVSIQKPNGGPRYTQLHVRRFDGLILQGKSPTMELLNDWGTTNCTVGDFVDILKSHNLLAPASLLLPDTVKAVTSGGRQLECPAVVTHYSNSPTTIVRDPAPEEPVSLSQITSAPVRTEPQPNVSTEEREPYSNGGFSSFCYHELMEVTGNFDDRPISAGGKRLGEGGFGTVYKGFINNTPVAVKKLSPMEEISVEELQGQFNQEVQTLKSLKHDNLVDMVGFSCDGQYPCLVYSYMENGSLLDRLACLDDSSPLSWRRRCLVCLGTARGLDYLHSNHHVHRDVKSANILLDENFVAKISDFGLTRASAKQTSTTMMTERIMGTCAYMAPEALRGEITPKSDIFSFGVVLLEILSGLPPVDENREPQLLMEMRYDIDDEDEDLTLEDFLDKKMKDWELSQVESTYSLACSCLHDRKIRRPLIKQVLSEIEDVVKSISPK